MWLSYLHVYHDLDIVLFHNAADKTMNITRNLTVDVRFMPPLSFFRKYMLGAFLFSRIPNPSSSCSISFLCCSGFNTSSTRNMMLHVRATITQFNWHINTLWSEKCRCVTPAKIKPSCNFSNHNCNTDKTSRYSVLTSNNLFTPTLAVFGTFDDTR